jgi:hypothetical protein
MQSPLHKASREQMGYLGYDFEKQFCQIFQSTKKNPVGSSSRTWFLVKKTNGQRVMENDASSNKRLSEGQLHYSRPKKLPRRENNKFRHSASRHEKKIKFEFASKKSELLQH